MLLAFALAYLGMLGLCLSMSRHHKALLGGEPGRLRQRMLRWAAAICFALALGVCSLSQGGEIGAVLWLCQLMLAALLLAAGAVQAATRSASTLEASTGSRSPSSTWSRL